MAEELPVESRIDEILAQSNIKLNNAQLKVLEEQLDLRQKQMQEEKHSQDYCKRNYTFCPIEFQSLGELCVAKDTYEGPCAKSFKRSEKCSSANYPCESLLCNDGPPVFDNACPLKWTQAGSICLPSADYHGPCTASYDLASKSFETRQLFSYVCLAPYSCSDFDRVCPRCPVGYNFNKWNGICSSLSATSSICQSINALETTDAQKNFARNCNTRFQCVRNGCVINLNACPKNFSLTTEGICVKTGALQKSDQCPIKIELHTITKSIAETLETNCGIQFSCTSQISKNTNSTNKNTHMLLNKAQNSLRRVKFFSGQLGFE